MNRAFSLVELSIVLVILGLLVGGVLSGQALIRASELRALTAEYQRYNAAFYTFRDKYFALPGDMTNATSFWTLAVNCPGDNTHIGTGTQTCDGDGNGTINNSAPTSNEMFRAWQHLANAGLIEGNYSGVPNSAVGTAQTPLIAFNTPKSKMGNTGWAVYGLGDITAASLGFYEGSYGGSTLQIGTWSAAGTLSGVLKPEEAWNIDTKLDDGKPATGSLVSREDESTTCTDTAASATSQAAANYNFINTALSCVLLFKSR